MGVIVGAASAYKLLGGPETFASLASMDAGDLQHFVSSLSEKVDELGPLAYAYFSLVYVVLEILALPALPLTASAGYLFGIPAGTATVLFSATVAAAVSFYIGRTYLRGYIENLMDGNDTFKVRTLSLVS